MSFLCGHPPGPAIDAEESKRLLAQFPDMAWCCFGSAGASEDGDLSGCSCWEPVYSLVQRELIPGEPVERSEQCADCAYRVDSPERTGSDEVVGNEELLERITRSGDRFWCHQGLRRPVAWRHPSGAELPGDAANYCPPIKDGVPYKANGDPADVCAGWAARRRLVLQSESA